MDDDMKFYNERLATLDEALREIQIEKKVIERLMARKSDQNIGSQDQLSPPVGECKRHTDWAYKLVVANPGKLKRDQIIRYLKTRIKCNSKDPEQSVGDALSKLVRECKLRVDDDGFYSLF
jgi:hypothetical protein